MSNEKCYICGDQIWDDLVLTDPTCENCLYAEMLVVRYENGELSLEAVNEEMLEAGFLDLDDFLFEQSLSY